MSYFQFLSGRPLNCFLILNKKRLLIIGMRNTPRNACIHSDWSSRVKWTLRLLCQVSCAGSSSSSSSSSSSRFGSDRFVCLFKTPDLSSSFFVSIHKFRHTKCCKRYNIHQIMEGLSTSYLKGRTSAAVKP